MRILVSTYQFPPSVGGLERACVTLCNGLVERGHDVTVVTMTPNGPGDDDSRYPFKVVRCPSFREQLKLAREQDVLWQHSISLRMAGLLIPRKPRIFAHHVMPRKFSGLKRLISSTGTNMYVSPAMRDAVGLPGVLIWNAYEEETFRLMPEVPRDLDFAYLGHLNRDKGVDVLIDALARLGDRPFTATFIGAGVDADKLKARAEAAGLGDRVNFVGVVRGEALVRLLNRHKVLVVPSRWEEPFGLVALEGTACGCVVVGTRVGGLVDAVGPCGPIVPKEDPKALAEQLERLLDDPEYRASFRAHADAHLRRFTRKRLNNATERLLRYVVRSHARANGEDRPPQSKARGSRAATRSVDQSLLSDARAGVERHAPGP